MISNDKLYHHIPSIRICTCQNTVTNDIRVLYVAKATAIGWVII